MSYESGEWPPSVPPEVISEYDDVSPFDVGADISYLDAKMSQEVAAHMDTLRNGERIEFRSLPFNRKIDTICWLLAEKGTPEDVNRAVEVRSMYLARKFESWALEEDEENVRDEFYSMQPGNVDPFWGAVQKRVDEHVQLLAMSMYGAESGEPQPALDIDPSGDTLSLVRINNRHIMRSCRRGQDGNPAHVIYWVRLPGMYPPSIVARGD